jgi:hypothetical protein
MHVYFKLYTKCPPQVTKQLIFEIAMPLEKNKFSCNFAKNKIK